MPNRLASESSPYLLQHKDNPVAWQPWGEAAFAEARRADKPLFVSIGYSTCHWCHVMERESFEDEEVAAALNAAFVPVKVDREERPDVDGLYMTACQLMRRQGGWPLNVFLTPEGKPFHAETYLPKTARFGRMGLLQLTERIRTLWQNERQKITANADGLTDALRQMSAPQAADAASGEDALGEDALGEAYRSLAERYDAAHGGFGGAPKFPAPHNLLFLLRYGHATGEPHATEMATRTLGAMRRGGIFDQLGHGFHRYATDARWLLPHFEKMAYDQAMLAMAYTEAHQATGEPRFRTTAEEVFGYVLRDLTSGDGAFFSAEDADSEGEEGTFYVWTTDEVRNVLGADKAALVIEAFGMEEEGNFREESTGEKTGANVLHLPDERLPDERPEASVDRERLAAARRTLLDHRTKRERPHRDDKVLTDWNGLMIAALAKAARAFDAPRYAEAAARAAAFLLDTMRTEDGGLLHRYRRRADGTEDAGIRAHLDDYAFLSWGLTELYEATFEPRWLRAARDLADALHTRFADAEGGGYFLAEEGAEQLLARQKPLQDAAMPSGNAGALLANLRLARLTGRPDFAARADDALKAAAAQVRRQPSGFTALLCGLLLAVGPAREVVVSGDPEAEATRALLGVVCEGYRPATVTLLRSPGEAKSLADLAPFTEEQHPVEGRPAAYVCQNHACRQPVTTPAALEDALAG